MACWVFAILLGLDAIHIAALDPPAAHAEHAAKPFFEYPGLSSFNELMKAAAKAGVEGPVRAAALRFLETGAMPFRVISPRPASVA